MSNYTANIRALRAAQAVRWEESHRVAREGTEFIWVTVNTYKVLQFRIHCSNPNSGWDIYILGRRGKFKRIAEGLKSKANAIEYTEIILIGRYCDTSYASNLEDHLPNYDVFGKTRLFRPSVLPDSVSCCSSKQVPQPKDKDSDPESTD